MLSAKDNLMINYNAVPTDEERETGDVNILANSNTVSISDVTLGINAFVHGNNLVPKS